MSSPLQLELSPLIHASAAELIPTYNGCRSSVTRASYTHADLRAMDRTMGKPSMKRSQSQPVMKTSHFESITAMSPMFYSKNFMASGGTMTSSAFNLASATLGAGVLALPHAMSCSGVVLGTLALLTICFGTVYSVYILVRLAEITGLDTIEELTAELIGLAAEKATAVIIVVFCWGVAVMFIVVMGDFTTPVIDLLGLSHVLGRRTTMVLFWACIMLPLSFVRKIDSLRYASVIGSVATLFLAAALGVQLIMGEKVHRPSNLPLFRVNRESLGALSTFLFSYCCQPVVLKVYSEMKQSSVKRMTASASYSMLCCTVVYILTGFFGTLAFGPHVQPNILTNLGKQLDSPNLYLAYFGMSLAVTMAFPMAIFPTRDSIVLALGYREKVAPCPNWIASGVAGLLAFAALIMGMFVPNIRVLFDLLGGVCGGTLSFLLPGVLALRCEQWGVADVGWFHACMAPAIAAAGVGMCVVGTYNSVVTITMK